jgi:hypothetical protein
MATMRCVASACHREIAALVPAVYLLRHHQLPLQRLPVNYCLPLPQHNECTLRVSFLKLQLYFTPTRAHACFDLRLHRAHTQKEEPVMAVVVVVAAVVVVVVGAVTADNAATER